MEWLRLAVGVSFRVARVARARRRARRLRMTAAGARRPVVAHRRRAVAVELPDRIVPIPKKSLVPEGHNHNHADASSKQINNDRAIFRFE